jgi:hypothetical protein
VLKKEKNNFSNSDILAEMKIIKYVVFAKTGGMILNELA